MKILMLNRARKLIGEAAHTFDLTEELMRAGHSVKLVLRANTDLLQRAYDRDLPVALAFRNGGGFHPVHSVKEFWSLRRLIVEFQPDVIHCHRGNDHGLAAAVLRSFPADRRPAVVRTRHRAVPVKNTISNRWLYLKNTDAVIAVSARAAESYGPMGPLIQDRMTTILSSVDLSRFRPDQRSNEWRRANGIDDDHLLVGLIARIQRVKGQRPFLESAARVAKDFPNARFLMAGAGPEGARQKLNVYIEELGLAGKVVFLGWVDNISAVTASLDVGVLASLGSEASSRIVYEYMASGVPVVATAVGCIPQIVGEPEVGLVVPPGDVNAMTEAISRMLGSDEIRADFARKGRERVESHHTRERWLNDILDVYNFAINTRSGQTSRRKNFPSAS